MQQQSGAHMDVVKDTLPGSNQREVHVRGTPAQQQQCLQLMNAKIAESTGDYNRCYVMKDTGEPAVTPAGPPMAAMNYSAYYGGATAGQQKTRSEYLKKKGEWGFGFFLVCRHPSSACVTSTYFSTI